MQVRNRTRGFTLIELLVVISIIGLLSSVVLTSLGVTRSKARDAARLSDLRQLQNSLELYRTSNGSYPATPNGSGGYDFYGACDGGGAAWGSWNKTTSGATGWVPNLAPTYISALPLDSRGTGSRCYLYLSDGTSYALLAHGTVETHPTEATNPRPRYAYDGVAETCASRPNGAYQTTFLAYMGAGECW